MDEETTSQPYDVTNRKYTVSGLPEQNEMTTVPVLNKNETVIADSKYTTISRLSNDKVTMETNLNNSTLQDNSGIVTTSKDVSLRTSTASKSEVTEVTKLPQDETAAIETETSTERLPVTTVPPTRPTKVITGSVHVTDVLGQDVTTTEKMEPLIGDISVTVTTESADLITQGDTEPLTTEAVQLPDESNLQMSNVTDNALLAYPTISNQNTDNTTVSVTAPNVIVSSMVPGSNTTSGSGLDSSTIPQEDNFTTEDTLKDVNLPDNDGKVLGNGTDVTDEMANVTTVQYFIQSNPVTVVTESDNVQTTQGSDKVIDLDVTGTPIADGGDVTLNVVSEAYNITFTSPTTESPFNGTTEEQAIIIPGVKTPQPIINVTVSSNDTDITTSDLVTPSTRLTEPPIVPIVTSETGTQPTEVTSPVTIPSTSTELSTPPSTRLRVSTTTAKLPMTDIKTSPFIKSTATEAQTDVSTIVTTKFQPSTTELSSSSHYMLLSTTPITLVTSTMLSNNSSIDVNYSKSEVPMAIGITAGILAFIAIIVLLVLFKKRMSEKKRRGAYLDEENVSDYQFNLKERPTERPNSHISNGNNAAWNNGYGDNSFINKPIAKNYFQDGIKENNNEKKKSEDEPVMIDVLHRPKSDVPPIPKDNRFSMGPMFLDSGNDDDPSTQHTYDTAYTHGTFKHSSKA